MGVNIWTNRNQVYLDIYHSGIRRREKLNGLVLTGNKQVDKETMRLAKIAKAKRAQQVFAGEWGLIDPIAGKRSFFSFVQSINILQTGKYEQNIQSALNYLKKYPGGDIIQIGQINEDWFTKYYEWLRKKVAIGTANNYTQILRIALNAAVKKKIIIRNPAVNVKRIKAPEAKIIWLNEKEINLLAKTKIDLPIIGEEIKKAFLFACHTGLRISDIKTLKWGDIEHNPPQITKQMEKTDEQVYIPLNASAYKIINENKIHDYESPIFPNLSKIKHCFYTRLKERAKNAGIKKNIGWHTARHAFAVLALENGCDIFTLSKLLGHTDVKTTQIYAKATDKMKRAAVDALPAVEIKEQTADNVIRFKAV